MLKAGHFLVYVKRQLGDGRGVPMESANYSEASLLRPAGHGFGQQWLYKLACSGQPAVIWLFSVMRYKTLCLPPSLDARISVTKAFPRGGATTEVPHIQWLLRPKAYAYAFDASQSPARSFYLPWNHFGPTLNQVLAGASMPEVESEVQIFATYARLLQHFQTPRRLAADVGAKLDAYAERVLAMPHAFISYRRRDAPVLSMQTAARAFHHGLAPWWDQWAMPRQVAQENELCASPSLNKALNQAIRHARYAITIESPTYGQSDATRLEWARIARAIRAGKLMHISLQGASTTTDDPAVAKQMVDQALNSLGH